MSKEFEHKFNQATLKSLSGDFNEAITEFTELIKTNPNIAALYYNRGIAHKNIGNLQQAIEDYSYAIRISPHADYYHARGLAYYSQDELILSIKDINNSIELDSSISKYFYSLGTVKLKLKQMVEAIDDFTKAILLNPQISDYYYYRSFAYLKISDYQKAIEDATRAIELNSKSADAFYNRGLSKIGIGLRDEGFIDLMKAGELGIKEAYDIIDRFKNDHGDFQLGQIINPDDPKIYFNYGLKCMDSNNFKDAINYFSKAIELDNNNVDAYYNRAISKEKI